MANNMQLFGKKKDKYPTKTSINLYFKDEKQSGISTFTLYLIIIIVGLFALSKIFVIDLVADMATAQQKYVQDTAKLNAYSDILKDYDAINGEYGRFSYSYLTDQEKIQDRMEVLAMLEATIFAQSSVQQAAISGNVISVNLTNIDLEETALLAKSLESYEMVESVTVNTASYGGTYATRMIITLVGGGK